jgi:hypothetical protein
MSILSIFETNSSTPGFRGILNRYPIPIIVLVLAFSIAGFYKALHRPATIEQAYYSTDDGATFFAQTTQVPPFDVGGREADGAIVYSCDNGKTRFVGYLYRYTADGKPKAEEALKTHHPGPPIGMEVKRPGVAGHWVPMMQMGGPPTRETAAAITNVKCPEGGGGEPFMVNP